MMVRANFLLDTKGMTIAELKKILSRFPEDAKISCGASSAYLIITYQEEHTFSQPKFATNDWNGQR